MSHANPPCAVIAPPGRPGPGTSRLRSLAIMAIVGVNLSLVHYFALMEFPALIGSNELVALIGLSAYFLGLSIGYLVSDRVSRVGLMAIGLCTLVFYSSLPFSARWIAGTLWALEFQGGIPPFLFLTVLLGVTPFYAVFLPRLIDSTDDESRTPGHRPRHWLVTLYATEILGSLVGLALVVVLSPANMRYILSLHLAGLGVLTFLWARARWRFFVPALAALPALYLVCFPALDRASISYFYRYRSELQRVDVLASEFSPYQRVDIFNGHEKQGMATYLYLNGNLFYGTSILNQHNLFVSILPNLMVPHPSNALVIGGGSLDNARHLAPRVGRLRIVELDATVVRLSREHIQERRGGFPTNWDLTLDDGKHFLGVYDGPLFDVISIDVPVPTFLQTAMLHSDRFFALARTRLAPGGVFSISLSGTYYAGGPSLNPRQSHLAHRVMAGLLKNFRHVTVVQGAGRDYAWASDRPLAFTSKEVFSRAVAFVEESGTKDEFKLPEFRFLEESEVRSRAKGFAPVGEADMQIALRMSINKLMTRFYDTGE